MSSVWDAVVANDLDALNGALQHHSTSHTDLDAEEDDEEEDDEEECLALWCSTQLEDMLRADKREGLTVIHYAVQERRHPVLQRLIAAFARCKNRYTQAIVHHPSILMELSDEGESPLHLAARGGDLNSVALLLSTSCETQNEDSLSLEQRHTCWPLQPDIPEIKDGEMEEIRYRPSGKWLKMASDMAKQHDTKGNNALHHAVVGSSLRCFGLLCDSRLLDSDQEQGSMMTRDWFWDRTLPEKLIPLSEEEIGAGLATFRADEVRDKEDAYATWFDAHESSWDFESFHEDRNAEMQYLTTTNDKV